MPPQLSQDGTNTKFTQNSFQGGMRRNVDPSRLNEDEYTFLSNARSRYGTIRPVKLPLELTSQLPAGKYQGLYGAGNFTIAFIDGKAYYRDFSAANSYFTNIPNFQMSAIADIIFAELVPASTVNHIRQAVSTDVGAGINLTNLGGGSPSVMIVQDGVSRPRYINATGASGQLQDFDDWFRDGKREYVPVGRQMLYYNGVLYLVSPDKKSIYRSVSGRPLDFMVVVDSDGNKLDKTQGSADAVSHRVDFDDITCLSRVNLTNIVGTGGGFLVTTSKNSYVVLPDFTSTIFGEPTFNTLFLFSTGAVNNFSVVELLGDTALIDFSSIRSFDAVSQTSFEGNNSPFSKEVFTFFENIPQTIAAAISFDNYGVFAVNTIYGPGLLFYDTLLQKWSSFDQYPGVGLIKQFAEIKVNNIRHLFFITADNRYFQAFSSTQTATGLLYTREFTTGNPDIELAPSIFRTIIIEPVESGSITITPVTDRLAGEPITKTISSSIVVPSQTPPISPPFGPLSIDTVQNRTFNLPSTSRGWKVGFLIQWNFDAQISDISLRCTNYITDVSKEEALAKYTSA